MTLLTVQASDSFRPAGMQSRLSVRSIEILPSVESTSTLTVISMPSGRIPSIGSCLPIPTVEPLGSSEIAWIMRCSE